MKLPKRIKRHLANTKRLREARLKHEKWLKSQGLDNVKPPKDFGYEMPRWEPDLNYPKTSDAPPLATSPKKEEMTYSGERKLVGIATMHKSKFAHDSPKNCWTCQTIMKCQKPHENRI